MTNQILHIKNDLEDSNRQTAKSEQREKTLKEEIEHIKSQYLDVQRAERTVRIDLEQIKRTVFYLKNYSLNYKRIKIKFVNKLKSMTNFET